MKSTAAWDREFNHEIEHALQARNSGKEGMARVCSRRAAGIVIAAYLTSHGLETKTNSAYERLTFFISLPGLEMRFKDIAGHFLLKVNPDGKLPVNSDLIDEARWLRENLL